MRQVPTYLIIGNGRMASHFCHYLNLLGLPFLQWSRKTHITSDLTLNIRKASHIIVLISDSSIPHFLNNLKADSDKVIVHFSGMLSLSGIYSAHPLMTFSYDLYDVATYQQVPFILEEGAPPLNSLLPGLPNQGYYIKPHLKPYYHALCVMSNNFSCLLWQKLFQEISNTFNLPIEIVFPYLMQSFKNLQSNPQGALTGPLVRGDNITINKHLFALEGDNFLGIYQSFVDYFQKTHLKKETPHEHI